MNTSVDHVHKWRRDQGDGHLPQHTLLVAEATKQGKQRKGVCSAPGSSLGLLILGKVSVAGSSKKPEVEFPERMAM